jgi:hypothetical protein
VTAEDRSFRRLLTQLENGGQLFGILGAHAIQWATQTRHSGARKAAVRHRQPLRDSFGILGAHGKCLWRTKFSSVKKGRFSDDLSAFQGRTLGILGAHNPICACITPSSRLPAVCGNVGILREEPPRRMRQGKA